MAPPEIDLVGLLTGQNIDPRRYVAGTVVGISWFLRLHWAVVAQSELFPGFQGRLFDQWALEAVSHILE